MLGLRFDPEPGQSLGEAALRDQVRQLHRVQFIFLRTVLMLNILSCGNAMRELDLCDMQACLE